MAKIHTCDCCGSKLGEIACSNKYGGTYCSVICADTAEATGGLNVSKRIRIINGECWSKGCEGDIFETYGTYVDSCGVYYYVDPDDGESRRLVHVDNCVVVNEESSEGFDVVNHPNHYTRGRFETIELIKEITSGYNDPFVSHCVGTSTKYLSRAPFKHDTPLEDLKKSRAYLDFAIKHLEEKAVDDTPAK
jgi:hypothetical protein